MARARFQVLFFLFPFGVPLRYSPMRQEKTNTFRPMFVSFSVWFLAVCLAAAFTFLSIIGILSRISLFCTCVVVLFFSVV